MILRLLVVLAVLALPAFANAAPALRVATFNASLNDDGGRLIARLRAGDEAARHAASVIRRVRPDVLLLNEFDYDPDGLAADLFQRNYLEAGTKGPAPIHYPYRHLAMVNTGEPSGLDLNGDGEVGGPSDAWGFGHHPGQFGMLVLSRYPIDRDALRSFRLLPWHALPGARRPHFPDGRPFHSDAVWQLLRLSSKAHWDVPIDTPQGRIHLLAAHPTPPVFDGPENLNGTRNFDEIRLWVEYLGDGDSEWLRDDAGRSGRLGAEAAFVIVGDLNADPHEGDTLPGAIQQLLEHPRVARFEAPRSRGAQRAGKRKSGRLRQRGDAAEDTAQFSAAAGNMRVDYVLPSRQFRVVDSGVFWPLPRSPEATWLAGSDHRLVWLDLVR